MKKKRKNFGGVNSQSKFHSGIYTEKKKVVELSLRKEAQTNERKNKHMTFDDRLEIQECLNNGMTFKAIAKRIGKDPTTVSKEVKPHFETHQNGYVTRQ